jgi:tetratricopeptide (TPR) repeat protein
MKRLAIAILYSLASFSGFGVMQALAQDGCPDVPILHHAIAAEITECTATMHNANGSSGLHALGQRPEVRAEALYNRGLLYQFEGKYDLAIADYTSAIGWQHDFLDAYEARGDAFADLGQPDKAKADYQVTGMDRGDDAERCWVRAVRGRPLDRALADCNAALKGYPDNPNILQSRCFVYYRMGNYAAAVADCETAEKSRPRYDEALYVGGLAKLRQGDIIGGNADIAAAHNANYQIADIYALFGVKQ